MNFIKSKIREFYLHDTSVDNIFINEYLPQAKGDFVKVYLYGLMYAEYGIAVRDEIMAKQLGLSQKEIAEAWNYWEEMGAVKRRYLDSEGEVENTVEFVQLRELMYATPEEEADEQMPAEVDVNVFGSEQIRAMFDSVEQSLGRSLSTTELSDMLSLVRDEHVPTEMVKFAVSYFTKEGKSSLRYIFKVIRSWMEKGLRTVDDINEYLQENDRRHYQYNRILRALGFTRNATEEERRLMDSWFDDLGFNMDRILEACGKTAGISSPNFNYVNKVLENWSQEAEASGQSVNQEHRVTPKVLREYYRYLRSQDESEAEARRAEVYEKVPEIRTIDEKRQDLMMKETQALLNQDEAAKKDIDAQLEQLQIDKMIQMTENGFEVDYMDVRYHCEKCKDTGTAEDGTPCTCKAERIEEAAVWLARQEERG